MCRLTFGVTSSPYLASQVLLQLADDYESECPRASKIIRSCFYVDDCLTGASTFEEAQELQQELVEIFKFGCMNLRKWRTNSKELLKTIPIDLRETKKVEITTAPSDQAKALGVHWDTEMIQCMYLLLRLMFYPQPPNDKSLLPSRGSLT